MIKVKFYHDIMTQAFFLLILQSESNNLFRMFKKLMLHSVALLLLATSCDLGNKDSYYTVPFNVYNVITDTHSAEDHVQFSPSTYSLKHNVTKDVISIDVVNLAISGQKVSFETDQMTYKLDNFKLPDAEGGSESYKSNWTFGGSDVTASGATLGYFNGKINWYYIPGTSNQLNPYFKITTAQGLNLSYQLNDRYMVQTINPYMYYTGSTSVSENGNMQGTGKFDYFLEFNFINKEATVYVYNRIYDGNNKITNPQMLCIQGVKFVTNHNGFLLADPSPKTKVRLMDEQGKESDLVENASYQVTDFSLNFMSTDYTQAHITFKMGGKMYTFQGTCIASGSPIL